MADALVEWERPQFSVVCRRMRFRASAGRFYGPAASALDVPGMRRRACIVEAQRIPIDPASAEDVGVRRSVAP